MIFVERHLPGIYFEEEDFFEISENKIPSKITCYTLHSCVVGLTLRNVHEIKDAGDVKIFLLPDIISKQHYESIGIEADWFYVDVLFH